MRDTTDWDSAGSVALLRAEIADRQSAVLSSLTPAEFTLRHLYENQAGFSGEVTVGGLNKLLVESLVAHIEPVRELCPALAQGIPLMSATQFRLSFNGEGMAIAICDTGVDYTHPMLGGGGFPNTKVIGGYDFGDDDADPFPGGMTASTAHGTSCAGLAGGDLGSVGDYIGGVAHNAKIYALKIAPDTSDGATTASMVAAWDWCVTHKNDDPDHPIMVTSTSYGGGRFFNSDDADNDSPAMKAAADNAVAIGITVLASSHNQGYTDSLAWPAAISSVISVGAVYDADLGPLDFPGLCTDNPALEDHVTCYSNTADFLDVLAPSHNAYTADIAGAGGYTGGDYTPDFGGTSAACPYAAGAVACLQSAAFAKFGDYLSPAEVRHLLVTSGDPITDTKVPITKPRVNLGKAISYLSYGPPIYVEEGCVLNQWQATDTNSYWQWDANTWDPNSNNIEQDPCFAADYYLSWAAADQNTNSPCVDLGSGDVNDPDINLPPDVYTTRTDGVGDFGIVDLGYHHRIASMPRLNVIVIDANGDPVDPAFAHGYVDPNISRVYPWGTEVLLIAHPDYGYRVREWTGTDDDLSTDPNNTVIMTTDRTVTVEFEVSPKRDLLLTIISGHGTVGLYPVPVDANFVSGGYVYFEDTVVKLTAHPDEGYRVEQWIGTDNDLSVELLNTVTMDQDKEVGVEFSLPRTIEVSVLDEPNAIQDAIDEAKSSDIIVVYAGTYYITDPIDFRGKDITVSSSNPDDPNVVAATIIDCQFSTRAFIFNSGEDANTVLNGLSIVDGLADGENGGAIYVDSNSSPTIANLIISNCTAISDSNEVGACGGAIYVTGDSEPNFINCTIFDCNADGGGAACCDANSSPTFYHCTFLENSAGWGGGMLCDSARVITVRDCNFAGNLAAYYGGGLCGEPNSIVAVSGGIFIRNMADNDGGALYWEKATMSITDANIVDNEAPRGGGLCALYSAETDIIGCTIKYNRAPNDVLDPNDPNDPNAMIVGEGGGIFCFATAAYIRDCVIARNIANTSGGGIYVAGQSSYSPEIINCLIANNLAGRDGGGISANWNTDPLIANCTIVANSAPGVFGLSPGVGLGGGFYGGYGSNSTIVDSILWNNNALQGWEIAVTTGFPDYPIPSVLTVSYSDVKNGQTAAHVGNLCTLNWDNSNINANPIFVTGPLGSYYLSQTYAGQGQDSPCVDTGSDLATNLDMTINEDMVAYTTRTDEVLDGGTVDMGYHYPATGERCGVHDFVLDGLINFNDLAMFALNWLNEGCSNANNWCGQADLTADSFVNTEDLGVFIMCWLVMDNEAPEPDPTEWEDEPYSTSSTSIAMTVKPAFDAWGWDVEYYFECVTDGNNSSPDWQSDRNYEVTGLTEGEEYCFKARARDGVEWIPDGTGEPGNKTNWSVVRCEIAGGAPDTTPPAPPPEILTVEPNAPNSMNVTATYAFDTSGVQYRFRRLSPEHYSGWLDQPIWLDKFLDDETEYCYEVQARDLSLQQNTTGWSAPVCNTTPGWGDITPPEPNPMTWNPEIDANGFSGYPHQEQRGSGSFDYWAVMEANEATDESEPVAYKFICSDSRYSSGGQMDPGPVWRTVNNVVGDPWRYEVYVGTAGKLFTFRVKARDAYGNETDASIEWGMQWPAP
ncbi:MAG: S8 family serine peptidase [Planctomycetota bacterium]